ncbi:hypothetical protein A3I53_01145 [Candidatus Curtissbacteria bacterium RIFCSPLOWO2_02_FULL_40_13b]|uniref:Uncharacterized protein n=1 Tax=Candidatus Curtissbacteria bacterium RIFCSPLOWO2_02_FULL_40_13b TaxID=1797733 RepID=A0A1F5HVS4_9BACT|nr:MAG: hypothetical protein A3I53_01145 [Candidatus Curtissbacteria bacterium RIFCSPLOWO2_02_FULL_40_13b]
MSREAKLLILTWIVIGLVVAGAVGFYLGRITAPKNQGGPQGEVQQPGPQQQGSQGGQPPGSPLPTGGQKLPQGGPTLQQGGQQNLPTGGEQPPPQK